MRKIVHILLLLVLISSICYAGAQFRTLTIDGVSTFGDDIDLNSGSILMDASETVDGRDVSADGVWLDTLYTTIGLSALTSAEVDQLENIGTTTIAAGQWGYLGGATASGGAVLDAANDAAILALLSGDAGATFDWNSQNLTGIGTIGAGAITGTSFIIGGNILDTNEWAFLDGQDQSVFIDSDVRHDNLTIETLGSQLWDAAASTFESGTYGWTAYGSNTIANDGNALKITYGNNGRGAFIFLSDADDLSTDLTPGKLYKLTFDAKVGAGDSVEVQASGQTIICSVIVTETTFTSKSIYFTSAHATLGFMRMGDMDAGENIWIDNIVLKEVSDGDLTARTVNAKGGDSLFDQVTICPYITLPTYKLHIEDTGLAGHLPYISFKFTDTAGSAGFTAEENAIFMGGVEFFGSAYATAAYRNAWIMTAANNNLGKLIFRTKTGGTYYDRTTIANNGDVDFAGATTIYATGIIQTTNAIYFTQTDGNEKIDSLNDNYMDYGATTAHRFNTDKMVILATGFVGIGITDPSHLLTIYKDSNDSLAIMTLENASYGDSAQVRVEVIGGAGTLELVSTSSTFASRAWKQETQSVEGDGSGGLLLISEHGSGKIAFYSSDTGASAVADMTIDSAGKVGIGTETPTAALQMGNDKLVALDTNSGLTASTTQSQGQGALTAQINEISTVANKDDTVTLPSAVTGIEIEIINNGANTLLIFPASGDDMGLGVDNPEELEANERVKFVAYDNDNWAKESTTEIIHAEIHDEDNTDAFVINDFPDFHSYHTNGLAAGDLADWIFDAGGAGTSHAIASIADGVDTGNDIEVTTADNHLLEDGDIVSQTGLTNANYVGIFVVKDIISVTQYEVAAPYLATGTGTMDQAATLETDAVAAGVYDFAYYISASPVNPNETYDFQLYKEATAIVGSKIRRKFGAGGDFGSMAGGGVVAVADGEKISFALSNEDSNANLTIRNLTIVLIRL